MPFKILSQNAADGSMGNGDVGQKLALLTFRCSHSPPRHRNRSKTWRALDVNTERKINFTKEIERPKLVQ